MGLSINTNLAALNTQRNIRHSTSVLGTTFQRMSSGLRINQAKDDSAGFSIGTRFETRIRSFGQLARNINDNISLLQVMDGGMSEVANLLQRGRELSVQAGNDTLSSNDRDAIQAELDQITSQIDFIAANTEFNGQTVLENASSIDFDSLSDEEQLVYALKRAWLEKSEDRMLSDNYSGR